MKKSEINDTLTAIGLLPTVNAYEVQQHIRDMMPWTAELKQLVSTDSIAMGNRVLPKCDRFFIYSYFSGFGLVGVSTRKDILEICKQKNYPVQVTVIDTYTHSIHYHHFLIGIIRGK